MSRGIVLFFFIVFQSWGDWPYSVQVSSPGQVQVLNNGAAALEKRLQMIERAQHSIELETFIYATDFAAKAITQALLKKARAGVQVRVLIDSFYSDFDELYQPNEPSTAPILSPIYAHFLIQEGLQIRYYNPLPLLPLRWLRYGQRNHRKLLSIDGKEMIIGGRNVANEYFDLGIVYNFMDRDIWVDSPQITRAAIATFEDYWQSPASKNPPPPRRPRKHRFSHNKVGIDHTYRSRLRRFKAQMRGAQNFLHFTQEEQYKLASFREFAQDKLGQEELIGQCEKISFATDTPLGANDKRREMATLLHQNALNIEQSLAIDAAYVVLNKTTKSLLDSLLERNIEVSLLTNSLHASDSSPVTIVFNTDIKRWVKQGLEAFVYSGDHLPHYDFFLQESYSAHSTTHSKTFVFDDHSFLISSYNFDPRSQNINNEIGLLCHGNTELTQGVLDNIQNRQDNAIVLDENGRYPIFDQVSLIRRISYPLLFIPSHFIDFLL